MIKRRLKGYVIPSIYILAITTILISVILVGNSIKRFNEENSEDPDVINPIIDNTVPVVGEVNDKIIKPFTKETVQVKKEFYDKDAEESTQQNSLIYYENTYMQNTGILYTCAEEFEVVATVDGTISNIKEDDILGVVIEIEHNSKLTTVYQSLKEAKVTVGQAIKQGEVIGVSGSNNIDTSSKYQLLFEVYHNGKLINPEKFYGALIKDFTE